MKRRPLSLFCLAVILFLLLGTKLTGTFPSEYEALEGESVTLVGSVYRKESGEGTQGERRALYLRPVPGTAAEGRGSHLLFKIKSTAAGAWKHRGGKGKAEML